MYFPHAFRKSFLPSTVASTTLSTATLGTTTGTVLAVSSATSIATGQSVSAPAGQIPAGTVVTGISGTNITISQPITAAIASGQTITFGGGTATPTLSTALNAPNVLQFAATTGVSVGMSVTGTSIPANTTVTAVTSTLVTLSNSVTATISTSASIAFGASVPVASSGSTAGLTAGQIGFFTPDGTALQSASNKPFIVAGGSYFKQDKIGPVHGGYKESWKSKMINPKYISRVIKVNANQPRQMVVKVPVTCGLACDTTYRLRVDVKGSPALRFLSHNMYRVLDSYTGCCDATNPTLQKDPVVTLLNWKDQINNSLIFNTMVQARVYKLAVTNTTTAANATSVSTTQATFVPGSFTSIAVGQKVVGTGIPANAFVTTVNGSTNITITYPTQQTAPAASVFNALSIKYYNDLYSGAIGTPQSGAATVIPGTGTESGVGGSAVISTGVATGDTIGAIGTGGAALYDMNPAGAASFSVDAHIELTAAYIETKFGNCTFTPTDKYDLEPLLMYTSIVDETGDACSSFCFTTTHSNTGVNTSDNDATVVQTPLQALGVGETVLRDLILSNRYLQNAYPDSGRVESLRMREIEVDPMLDAVSRTALYDQVLVLHSVPRFNNPTGTFDNDQYLLVFYVPTGTSTTALTNYLVAAATAAGNSIPTNAAGGTFELY
jgi:hypothetical protein